MVAWKDFLSSNSLAEGATKDEILKSYPSIHGKHIDAAIAYAAEPAHEERLVPIRPE